MTTFAKYKQKCGECSPPIFIHDGLDKKFGNKWRLVDKCVMTGAQCMSSKCPGFHDKIKPTNALANVNLEDQYKEEMESVR